jgi:hypothetical protein
MLWFACQPVPRLKRREPGEPRQGPRIEREIVARHIAIGIKAERVPLSGSARYRGNGSDIDVYAFGPDAAPLVGEVKARANGESFTILERWLGDADLLFLRRDRAGRFRDNAVLHRAA